MDPTKIEADAMADGNKLLAVIKANKAPFAVVAIVLLIILIAAIS